MNDRVFLIVAVSLLFCGQAAVLAADDPPADSTLAADQAKAVGAAVKHDAKVVADAAKDGAKQVAVAAKEVAHEVAVTTKEGAQEVAATAKRGAEKAKAAVDEAQRQLDHATVRAPFAGTVGEVDSLQPGTLVVSALAAFTTTSAVGLIGKDVWISSDMKETDLTHVHPGAPVEIAVDTYPDCKWSGHVDSVSAGSDSSFSALPAENGSGNWVKVVQRIPVRVAIDKSLCDRPLRAGMSAVISIDTGKRRIERLMDGF